MKEEFISLHKNNTWELVDLPPGRKLVKCKWVFKTKFVDDDSPLKYKEIFVSRDYSHVHGIYYNETFAPVEKMDSIRLALAIAASKEWEVHHMDVKSSFIPRYIKEEIYIYHLEGVFNSPYLVCRLNKSLYGIKKAPKGWYAKIDGFLLSQKFSRRNSDPNVYLKLIHGSIIIFFVCG